MLCLGLAGAAGLLVFFAASAGAGALIAIAAKETGDVPRAASAEFEKLVGGLNISALKQLAKDFEVLKATHEAPPYANLPDAEQSHGRENGRRRMSSIWTPTEGYNRLTARVARTNWWTLMIRDKMDVLDQWCEHLERALASNTPNDAWFAYWLAVNLGIHPSHFHPMCVWKPHVELMYTVKYRYGTYHHAGNALPGTTQKDAISFRHGLQFTDGRTTT